jgi:hypothetical protein
MNSYLLRWQPSPTTRTSVRIIQPYNSSVAVQTTICKDIAAVHGIDDNGAHRCHTPSLALILDDSLDDDDDSRRSGWSTSVEDRAIGNICGTSGLDTCKGAYTVRLRPVQQHAAKTDDARLHRRAQKLSATHTSCPFALSYHRGLSSYTTLRPRTIGYAHNDHDSTSPLRTDSLSVPGHRWQLQQAPCSMSQVWIAGSSQQCKIPCIILHPCLPPIPERHQVSRRSD